MKITTKKIKFKLVGNAVSIEKAAIIRIALCYVVGLLLAIRLFQKTAFNFGLTVWDMAILLIPVSATFFFFWRSIVSLMGFFGPEIVLLYGKASGLMESSEKKIRNADKLSKPAKTIFAILVCITIFIAAILVYAFLLSAILKFSILNISKPANILEGFLLLTVIPLILFLFDKLGRKIGWRKSAEERK